MGILVITLLICMSLLPNNFLGKYNLTARIILFLIFMDLWARKGRSVFKVNRVRIRQGPLDIITSISLLGLFLWISFFAPLIGGRFRLEFLLGLIISLAIFAFFGKEFGSLIFNKKEAPLWIFLLTMTGGLINGINPDVAYHHFRNFIFIIPFIYFFAKTAFQERYATVILRGLCFMALAVCIFGIIEFFTRQNFMYKLFIKNEFYRVFIGRRIMSTHVHAIPLGTYLVAVLPLGVMQVLKEEKFLLKVFYLLATIVIFISIILTFSRGALLGACIAILMMIVILTTRPKIAFILALILPLAVMFGYSSFEVWLHDVQYLKIGNAMGFYRYSLQGLANKLIYFIPRFKMCLAAIKDHPFLGAGLGHYRVLFDYYLPDLAKTTGSDCKVADSVYITLLTETGLVGFAGFVSFIFFLFKNILHKLKLTSEYRDRLLIAGFLSGFTGILCTFLTYDGLYWIAPSCLFWTYAGILACLSVQKVE